MALRIRFEHSLFEDRGVPSRYVALANHLDATLFTPSIHGTSDVWTKDDLPEWMTPHRKTLRNWARFTRAGWYQLGDFCSELEILEAHRRGGIDLVHYLDGEHSGQFFPSWAKARGETGVLTVATFHQPPSVAERVVAGESLHLLDAIVVVSPSQVPFFRRYVHEDRIHVILHGADTILFHPAEEPKSNPRLRCITTGFNLRDWSVFLAVAGAMPDVDFEIATAATLDLTRLPNVTSFRGLTDEELARKYRAADVLFLPLRDATANNSLLEGLASGLPIVSTNLESVRAYVSERQALLVQPGDITGCVGAVRELQNNKIGREELGRQSRMRAEELAWPRIAREYEALYQSLVAGTRKAKHWQIAPLGAAVSDTGSPSLPLHAVTRANVGAHGLAAVRAYGSALMHGGLAEEARSLLSRSEAAFPEDPAISAGLAELAEQGWKWRRAIEHWDTFIDYAPAAVRAEGVAKKALCLAKIGEFAEADDLTSSISDQFDGYLVAAELGAMKSDLVKAENLWEACTFAFPDRIEAFLGWARLKLEYTYYESAEDLLSHILGVWPEAIDALILAARCATEAGDLALARKRWEAAASVGSEKVAADQGYARYLAACGTSEDEVKRHIDRTVPHRTAGGEMLLVYHLARRDFHAALAVTRELAGINPWCLAYRRQWIEVLLRIGTLEAVEVAHAEVQGLLDGSPEYIILRALAIETYLRMGQERRALEMFRSFPREPTVGEIISAWEYQWQSGNTDGDRLWRTIYLDFSMLARSRQRL